MPVRAIVRGQTHTMTWLREAREELERVNRAFRHTLSATGHRHAITTIRLVYTLCSDLLGMHLPDDFREQVSLLRDCADELLLVLVPDEQPGVPISLVARKRAYEARASLAGINQQQPHEIPARGALVLRMDELMRAYRAVCDTSRPVQGQGGGQ